MKTLQTDTVELSGFSPWIAYRDAAEQNDLYEGTFSNEEHQLADALEQKAEDVWEHSQIYRNYRKTFIAVKIERPVNYKPNVNEIAKLDAWATKKKIQICNSNTAARIYRILKKK